MCKAMRIIRGLSLNFICCAYVGVAATALAATKCLQICHPLNLIGNNHWQIVDSKLPDGLILLARPAATTVTTFSHKPTRAIDKL